ncbi:MAG: sensory protein TspO [Gammaproteobacteria bacterium]|jgi:tryptophan-rich sensory protein|nr:TspO/MBR family protein [Gammaproteobacteria bacterium]MDX2459377.1 TspO/MBR family protein [Gammaproteobacteria bacterium]NCF28545.1 sensory protein TspO [Gammaproteobacteria bacterium]
MSVESTVSLAVFVFACAAAATPGIVFRPGDWYRALAKPSWRPPDWLFGPVWFVLYLCIAVSGWLVWRVEDGHGASLALTVYAVHLVLNGLWSVVFFRLRRPDLAFVEIVCLWFSILATMVVFHPVNETASYILVPYSLWVTFAMVLNFRIWRLNSAGPIR